MYTLTYESIALKNIKQSDVSGLLKTARLNNEKNGITGCLIYYRGGFVQVLEGDKKNVLELYEKIKVDRRHTNVHLFSEDSLQSRTFPDWGMAYYPIDETATSKNEFEQFRRNILLLADLTKPTSVTAIRFWKRIKFLISHAPEGY